MPEDNQRRNVRPIEHPSSETLRGSQLVPIDQSHLPVRSEQAQHTRGSVHPLEQTQEGGGGDRHNHQHIHIHMAQSQPQYSYRSWSWTSYSRSSTSSIQPAQPSLPAPESLFVTSVLRCVQLAVWLGAIGAGVWFTGKFMGWF